MNNKTNIEQPNNLTSTDIDTESFEYLYQQSLQNEFKQGEVVKNGTVIAFKGDYVIVDIGFKSEGSIALEEFLDSDGHLTVEIGDKVDVYLEAVENEDGSIQLSKEKADKLKIWDEISKACEADEIIEGQVISRVKGGLQVDIGVKAFLPGSQVDLRPIRNLDKLIGQTLHFKILKFNKKRGNIVLSRRVLLEKELEEMRRKTLETLKEGAIIKGTVKNITDYGVFLDLGGIDGLLHITDMSWGRVKHPSELFNLGDEINVMVLKYDKDNQRVSLGLKQIFPDPWQTAAEKYPVTTRVKGKVVSIADYGAFIEIEEGIEGLIHISEMTWSKKLKHPSKIVAEGDIIEAVVLDIDALQRRISLGMKQLTPNPWDIVEEKYPVGTKIKGKIRNITDFGIFIGLDEGIDGLIHISDISWSPRMRNPSELYKKGDEIDAVVLNIDKANERFSLGIKQLSEDPWKSIPNKYPLGTIVEGEVVSIVDFGVFLRLEQGVEGLVHISELTEEKIDNPASKFKVGDKLRALVTDVDQEQRKIRLSVVKAKAATEKDIKEYIEEARTTMGEVMIRSAKLKEMKLAPKKKSDAEVAAEADKIVDVEVAAEAGVISESAAPADTDPTTPTENA
jgi:small subunit ribosomal protein S1